MSGSCGRIGLPIKWTEGRRKGFITSALRAGMRRWPPKYQALAEAFTGTKKNKATGRMAKHYRCNSCNKEFVAAKVQVDHIEPVVSAKGFTTWDDFIDRLFCEQENLQVLCLTCHKKKSALETQQRKKK
jgi:5-methylcytosine-specific restriction endonuclease McrA